MLRWICPSAWSMSVDLEEKVNASNQVFLIDELALLGRSYACPAACIRVSTASPKLFKPYS